MRFAIYGAGGLGAYYGARLADAGEEVGFIARGSHLAAIQSNGLKVLSPIGDIHLSNPLATSDPAEIGVVDIVIVAVKTWQIPEIAAAIGPLIRDNTIVIPFLNGVEEVCQHIQQWEGRVFEVLSLPSIRASFLGSRPCRYGALKVGP